MEMNACFKIVKTLLLLNLNLVEYNCIKVLLLCEVLSTSLNLTV